MGDLLTFPVPRSTASFLDVLTIQLYQLEALCTYSQSELQQRGISDDLRSHSFPLHSFSAAPHYYGASLVCQALNQHAELDAKLNVGISLPTIISINSLGGVRLRKGIVQQRLHYLAEQKLIPVADGILPTRYFNTLLWDVLHANFDQEGGYAEKVTVLAPKPKRGPEKRKISSAVTSPAPEAMEPRPYDQTQDYDAFIRKIAYRLTRRLPLHVHVEDLISAGWEGLLDAQEKYDGVRDFKTYAVHRVQGAIIDALRSLDPLGRDTRARATKINEITRRLSSTTGEASEEDIAVEMGLTVNKLREVKQAISFQAQWSLEDLMENQSPILTSFFASQPEASAEEEAHTNLILERVQKALHRLPERRREVVKLYFFQNMLEREIGDLFGFTESRACQILAEGVCQLRSILRAQINEEDL